MWTVGHAQVAWALSRWGKLEHRDRRLVTLCGVLPDLDGLSLLFGVEAYYRVHHVWMHNLFTCAVLGAGTALLARRRVVAGLLGLAGALLHLLSDSLGLLTLQPFWPFSGRGFMMDDGNWALAACGEVLVPLALMAWQVRVARREHVTVLEAMAPTLDQRFLDWFARRWRERRRGTSPARRRVP